MKTAYAMKFADAFVALWGSLPPVPEKHRFALCPKCESLLAMSPDRYPNAHCACGFYGKPERFLTEQEAEAYAEHR